MVPIVQKQVSEVLVVISRRWAVNKNATEDAVPSLDVEMAVIPATSVLGCSPLVREGVTCQLLANSCELKDFRAYRPGAMGHCVTLAVPSI